MFLHSFPCGPATANHCSQKTIDPILSTYITMWSRHSQSLLCAMILSLHIGQFTKSSCFPDAWGMAHTRTRPQGYFFRYWLSLRPKGKNFQVLSVRLNQRLHFPLGDLWCSKAVCECLSWLWVVFVFRVDVAHLVLFNLTLCYTRKYYDLDETIMPWIAENEQSLRLDNLLDVSCTCLSVIYAHTCVFDTQNAHITFFFFNFHACHCQRRSFTSFLVDHRAENIFSFVIWTRSMIAEQTRWKKLTDFFSLAETTLFLHAHAYSRFPQKALLLHWNQQTKMCVHIPHWRMGSWMNIHQIFTVKCDCEWWWCHYTTLMLVTSKQS